MTNQQDYHRNHLNLPDFGKTGQAKLAQSQSAMIGLGGLGSAASQTLVASGIGHLQLFDADLVSSTNLSRQLIYRPADIGHSKAKRAQKFLQMINPHCQIEAVSAHLQAENCQKNLSARQIIIDATDNFRSRFEMADYAFKKNKNFISADSSGYHGYLSIYKNSPKLPCFRCFHQESDALLRSRSCVEQGIFSPILGVLGNFLASETIKEIIMPKQSLAGQMLIIDCRNNHFRLAKLSKDPACQLCHEGRP